MKSILCLIALFVGTSAMAGPTQFNYGCGGQMQVRIRLTDGRPSAMLTMTSLRGNGILNVVSSRVALAGSERKHGADFGPSVDFVGFMFPNGDRYIGAEGTSNDEGFIFSAEPEILDGAAQVQAAAIYWGNNRRPDIQNLNCVRH